MEPSSTQLVLDLSQLRNVTLNDEALMREVLGALVSDTSDQIQELNGAIERSDKVTCVRLAHSAHGACGNVGAVSLAALFSEVETYARQGDFRLCRVAVASLAVGLEKLRSEADSI
jgi:HPt (histidine-containing phosphotransfer) domain-containing protein